MRCPPGEYDAKAAPPPPVTWVSLRRCVPFARMVNTSLPGRQQLLLRTRCDPSGDQLGQKASRFGLVNRTGRLPRALITQIADVRPPRSLLKAMRLPSGENV